MILPLRADLWHHRGMLKPKPSRKPNPDSSDGTRGIVGAAEQDLELTIEQAEDAAKHVVQAAASALGFGSVDKKTAKPSAKKSTVAVAPSAKKRPIAAMPSAQAPAKLPAAKRSAAAKKPAPSRAPRSKPKS